MLQVPTEFQGLREISLFSGGGGGVLASKILGWQTVAYVEWDKFPQKVLKARIADGLIDDAPVFGDVQEFDGKTYKGKAEVVSGGFPCFVAGTLVLTDEGYKAIEDVQVGDRVLTHRGRWRLVIAIMIKQDAPVREIKAQGVPGVVCTDEHPFYTRFRDHVWDNTRRRYVRRFGDPEWVDASELVVNKPGTPTQKVKSHFLGQVLPPERPDENTEAFWWVIGRYLADGWRVERKDRPKGNGRVIISCNHNEADDLEQRIKAAGYHGTRSKERTATKFHIVRNDLFQMTEAFGHLAHGKHLNERVLSLPAAKARAVCEGYFTGDGCRQDNARGSGTHLSCSTVSKALALGMALLAQRAYGVVASVRLVPTEDTTVIKGREVNQRDFYRVTVPERNKSAILGDGYGWKNIRSNEPKGRATVFNIAVEEDESYVADGAIVHNCQPFSVAGKRQAQDDERNMWPATLRIISEVQPKYAFLENVPGLLSAKHGYFATILSDLADIGYEAVWDCVPASAVEAPHRRDRLWILARPARRLDPARREFIGAFASRDADTKDWSRLGVVGEDDADWARCGAMMLYTDGSVLSHRTPRMAFPDNIKTRYGVWPWPSLIESRPAEAVDDEGRHMWRTPNTFDGVSPKSQAALDHEATHRVGRATPNNLRDQVNVTEGNAEWKGMWPTPRTAQASMYAEDADTLAERGRDGMDTLAGAVAAREREMYPTPRANDWKGPDMARDENRSGARHGGDDLATAVEKREREMFPTPTASDADRGPDFAKADREGSGSDDLVTHVAREERQNWPTPRKGGLVGGSGVYHFREKLLEAGTISEAEASGMFDGIGRGKDPSTKDKSKPVSMLNPDWVEWLMGWPIGWTRLEEQPPEPQGAWQNQSPAGVWWDNEPEGLPRVTIEKKNRTVRLKALGNGQVSLCAAAACAGLYEMYCQLGIKQTQHAEGHSIDLDDFFDL